MIMDVLVVGATVYAVGVVAYFAIFTDWLDFL